MLDAINAGMKGAIGELVAMGFTQAGEREPERAKPRKTPVRSAKSGTAWAGSLHDMQAAIQLPEG